MERSGTSRAFRGLWIDVDGPTMPQMRVEIAPPRQLRIVQGDETVMLGWVDPGHLGVEFLRTGSFESAVAPIPASEARRRGEVDDAERWFSGWCHEFVDALESSDIAAAARRIVDAASGADSQRAHLALARLPSRDPRRGSQPLGV